MRSSWGAKGYHPQHHTIGIRKANQTSSAKLKSDKGGRQCEQTEGDKSTNEVGGVPEFMTTSTPTKRPPSFEKSPQILQSQTHRLEELPKPASTLPRAQYSEAPTGNNDDNTSQGASRSNNWPRPGQHPCAQGIKGESQEGSTSHQDAPCSPNYITYSYYNFLSISNLYIPPQDFQFLELRGCLRVPVRPILDEFVRQYFLHIHPMLPILDEGGFWDMYLQRSDALHNVNISLLVFQTMLFNCCNVSSSLSTRVQGLRSHRADTVCSSCRKLRSTNSAWGPRGAHELRSTAGRSSFSISKPNHLPYVKPRRLYSWHRGPFPLTRCPGGRVHPGSPSRYKMQGIPRPLNMSPLPLAQNSTQSAKDCGGVASSATTSSAWACAEASRSRQRSLISCIVRHSATTTSLPNFGGVQCTISTPSPAWPRSWSCLCSCASS